MIPENICRIPWVVQLYLGIPRAKRGSLDWNSESVEDCFLWIFRSDRTLLSKI